MFIAHFQKNRCSGYLDHKWLAQHIEVRELLLILSGNHAGEEEKGTNSNGVYLQHTSRRNSMNHSRVPRKKAWLFQPYINQSLAMRANHEVASHYKHKPPGKRFPSAKDIHPVKGICMNSLPTTQQLGEGFGPLVWAVPFSVMCTMSSTLFKRAVSFELWIQTLNCSGLRSNTKKTDSRGEFFQT